MSVFISLVIFGLGLFLFFITNNKLKKIKDNILIDDTKKELEGLITEFNSAAARNIELLESKINELQETINRANSKMTHLDDKIGRANRPFVVEKIVDRSSPPPAHMPDSRDDFRLSEPSPVLHKTIKADAIKADAVKANAVKPDVLKTSDRKTDNRKKTLPAKPEKKSALPVKKENLKPSSGRRENAEERAVIRETVKTAPVSVNTEPLTRHEQLKQHIQEGKSKEELIALGFMENEINLLNFLIKKKI